MRDWRVRKPSADASPIDWSKPDPPPEPRPNRKLTPWGQVFRPCADGYWRVHRSDPALSYPALLDKIDRFELRWTTLRPGICYRVVPLTPERGGPRLAVLWRNGDGTYRSGHVALRGERDGVWLAQHEPFRRAASRIELWWLGMGVTRAGYAPVEWVAQRLRVSPDRADASTPGTVAPAR